jgi:predicted MFS family arabinose efflux permease
LSDQQLGLLTGLAFAAFYSILALPLAWFADRTHRVRFISGCLAIWSVMTALGGFAQTALMLFFARMGVAVGEAGCVPTAHSLIGDYVPRERRALAISIFQTGSAIGVSGGLVLVGLLGQHLGWRASLQIIGLSGLPFALLALLTLREPPRPRTATAARDSMVQVYGALLRRPALLHLALGLSLASICTYGIGQWLPTLLIRSFGMNMAQAGSWLGLVTVVSGIVGLVTGGLASTWLVRRDTRWELWLPAIAFSLSLPLFVALFLSPTAWLALSLKVCANFLTSIALGVSLAAVQSFAEPNRRAAAISLVLLFSNILGGGVGPYLIGMISDILAPSVGRESLRYALLASCAMLGWAVIHYVLAARRSLRDRLN